MIGYYVHHQGRGHLTRMRCITRRMSERVTVLSSLDPESGDTLPWVRLDRDDTSDDAVDVTAHGTLHFVPRHDRGLAARSATITSWIAEARPRLLVVDVSVEVAALARLCGTPVVMVAMPGDRNDRAHALAYDLADALLAPWPPGLDTGWPEAWTAKAFFLGGLSRFDGMLRPPRRRTGTASSGRGLVLWGSGGNGLGAQIADSLRTGTPDWTWQMAGLVGRNHDSTSIWQALSNADVVVTHGGQNTIAEVAAARAPAIVVADERPFAEQNRSVAWLADAGLAATVTGCPEPDRWPILIEEAMALDAQRWDLWNFGNGALTAATVLENIAHRLSPAEVER